MVGLCEVEHHRKKAVWTEDVHCVAARKQGDTERVAGEGKQEGRERGRKDERQRQEGREHGLLDKIYPLKSYFPESDS